MSKVINSIRQKLGFMGNPKIRREGVDITLTPQQAEEYYKCLTDPIYFIEHYIYIKVLDKADLQPFIIREYQREMITKFFNERNVIVKLPRQAGKTVCVSAVLLWHALFNKNHWILIAANNQRKAQDVLSTIKKMYELLPTWLQQGIKDGGWNKKEILLENGSVVRAVATSESAGRGDTYNMIYLDEFAFVPPHLAEGFMESVFPTISSGTTSKLFITSTPKGLNLFYRMWQEATTDDPEKNNGYAHVEIKWHDVPGRDDKFRDDIIRKFGRTHFDQEYAAEFLGSSSTLISGQKLLSMFADKPLSINHEKTTKIYAKPIKGHHYAICADVSEGLGADYSAVVVFDVTKEPFTMAATYRSNQIDPMVFPGVIHDIARTYNNALVLVESNFGGNVGAQLQQDLEYENVVMTVHNARKGQQAAGNYAQKSRVGMQMNPLTKRIGCSNLKSIVESDRLIVCDDWTINELSRFVVSKKSYAAEEGNDDLAMCLVMFGWLVDQDYIRMLTDINVRKSIAEQNAERIENELAPAGISAEHFFQEQQEIQEKGFSRTGVSWLLGGAGSEDLERDIDKEQMAIYDEFMKHFDQL